MWSALALTLGLVATSAHALPRSPAVKAEFQRQHPCPSTGKRTGACPGWVKDHVVPLCAGGADHPSNMQWQTVAEARTKDREEVRECRTNRIRRPT